MGKRIKNFISSCLLAVLVAFTACIGGGVPSDGLTITLQADPSSVFTDKETKIFLDVANNDVKTYENIVVEIFDMGIMTGPACSDSKPELRPGNLFTKQCSLKAPSTLTTPAFRNSINARAIYDTKVSGITTVQAMTEDEYNRLSYAGKLFSLPLSKSFSDKNILAQVDFDENPYVYTAVGRKLFMHIKIFNIGNGFVEQIKLDPARDIVDKSSIVNCGNSAALRPVGKEFPTITCELTPAPARIESYDIGLTIRYTYDVRTSAVVDIVR
ncbi:MAG: hypothetical protein HY513_02350 [Candidatus Aenigmarchaeota archaeon]|nr:hypothetical protein [Candidatus Aenigmarchaeota archaeon]